MKIKRLGVASALLMSQGLVWMVLSGSAVGGEASASLTGEARALADTFQIALKKTLLTAMNKGGPAGAVSACQLEAPQIADALSTQGWQLRRTALQVRNPQNAPSEWERQGLLDFSRAIANGSPPEALSIAEIRSSPEGPVFYYMQPIMTGALCLVCHGSTLSPELDQALQKHYPEDQATGFTEGDLRGAFSFSKVLRAE